ncbi:hypothetical protein CKO15_10235 [Halorhodospira abdelmalekii]|uniref:hypothetical protein n=1 Tax=Halorhodospira abdelmalekii TaxID=421629 RepID=UPI001904CF25|nr:hypothetical protein [Halorhodospira abdelmalekii]MBK1735654.1 hypothetical protein [Halorhodospira abdelmalekii]
MRLDLPIRAAAGEEWSATAGEAHLAERMIACCGQVPRRTSRLMQMAQLGAQACIEQAYSPPLPSTLGVLFSTSHGNVAETVRMMHGALETHQAPMPFDFINVSNNLAPFHVAQTLGIEAGANLMVSRGIHSFIAALEIALLEPDQPWLIGVAEACAWPLATHRRRLRLADEVDELAEATYWVWLDPACREAPLGRLQGLFYCATLDDLQSEMAVLSAPESPLSESPSSAGRSAGDLGDPAVAWLALGSGLDLQQRTALLQGGVGGSGGEAQLWSPPGSGFHPAIVARQLCSFLLDGRRGDRLLFCDYDSTRAAWLLVALQKT